MRWYYTHDVFVCMSTYGIKRSWRRWTLLHLDGLISFLWTGAVGPVLQHCLFLNWWIEAVIDGTLSSMMSWWSCSSAADISQTGGLKLLMEHYRQ